MEAWLAEHDLRDAVELMGAKPLLLIHARGDDQIPADWSEELFARAGEPRKLILLPGGHHRSAQHDAELHGLALRWMERNLALEERRYLRPGRPPTTPLTVLRPDVIAQGGLAGHRADVVARVGDRVVDGSGDAARGPPERFVPTVLSTWLTVFRHGPGR